MRYINKIFSGLLLVLIHSYRLFISPILPKGCRFLPSCSEYAIDAIKVHGTFYGSYLIGKRLLKCHPFGGHGLDMVPKNTHISTTPKRKHKCQTYEI